MDFKRFVMVGVVAAVLVACGDEASDKSPVQVAEESSSSVDEVLSSSVNVEESSSSFESEGLSSSVESGASSSSEKSTESSSGKNTEPAEVSSCSVAEGSSSSTTVESSSSSVKVEQSSSSEKVQEPSSSSEIQESSSSVKIDESSSSAKVETSSSSEKPVESSSSEKVVESSSSEEQSSSSVVENSSSSLESTGICKTKTEDNCVYGSLYDERDGKTYKTVKIGNQEWMAENLNYVTDNIQNTSQKSYCPMSLDSCAKYGRYYTWTGAIDSISIDSLLSVKCGHGAKKCDLDTIVVHGVCPKGWHIPSISEWNELIFFVGNSKSGKLLKSFEGWSNWPGEDAFGFTVLGAGSFVNGSISDKGKKASIWVAADATQQTAKCVDFNYSELKKDEMLIQSNYKETATALPVRCIKD